MAAPKGNQFWKLRSKHGRDKLFATPELLWESACEYFQWCNENPWNKIDYRGKLNEKVEIPTERPFTLTGLCLYLNTNDAYFRQFKANLPPGEIDFSTVITRIEDVIRTQKLEGAIVGAFNPTIVSRELGLKENIDHTTDGQPISVRIVENGKGD